ncbi:MAG: helix-turn-helix domain-containing protein [Rickettsiales bacterium]|nr:helix-turn-helix domain-containing protein [Rickettsiales bacterium]
MSELEQNQQIEEVAPAQSVGQFLREKRQEAKIEIAAACAYLKVKSFDIEALEEDNLECVTKHIYILGLIRSYAKFLKIAPQEIEEKIKLLSVKSNTDNKNHMLINIGEDPKVSPNKDSVFNFLLISILLFLVLLSLYNAFESNEGLITNETLVRELEKIDSLNERN